mmetsp:Transcript_21875/g.49751  ORF Transcript_21875/g.49751 Transcript_21875/m.49751 type:complete len:125 (+) Transcript_21875:1782-2156(+)
MTSDDRSVQSEVSAEVSIASRTSSRQQTKAQKKKLANQPTVDGDMEFENIDANAADIIDDNPTSVTSMNVRVTRRSKRNSSVDHSVLEQADAPRGTSKKKQKLSSGPPTPKAEEGKRKTRTYRK